MKDKLIIKQDNLKDCGVSSLLSIIRYYNGDAPKEYLLEITKTTKDGVNAYNLIEAARILGFNAQGVTGNLVDLKKNHLPLIAHVIINKSYKHFVVIYKINFLKKTLTIMDPSVGLKTLTFNEWNSITTNNYLILKPKKIIPKLVSNKSIIDIIKPFILNYKIIIITIFFLSILYTIINIITSYNFTFLLDETNTLSNHNIKIIIFFLFSFIITKVLIELYRNNLINYLNHHLDQNLFNETFRHIINLPYLYYKNRTTGDIITRLNDLSNVKELISRLFITIIIDSLLIIIILYFLIRIDKQLTLIATIIMILYFIIMLLYNQKLHKLIKDNYDNASHVNTSVIETINMVNTVKSMSLQNTIINKICNKYQKLNNSNFILNKTVNNENFYKNIVFYLGNIIITYIGVLKIKNNKLTITTLITFTNLLTYYLEPIKNIIDLNLIYKNAKESLKRILELYQIKEEKITYENNKHIKKLYGNIKFHQVSYSYNGVNNVIDNVSLMINSQEKVLIYGSSGNGKSTLMKLLTKYLTNYNGTIEIDNINLNNISLYDIRDKICYVSQNENLFTDSIYNNIVLERNINYEEFLKICKLTLTDDIVNKKDLNYDFLLEEDGFNLSGGERQRIILARSLLKKADIYIFDEALNSIDVQRERTILKNIFSLYSDKTIIVISHRFNNSDLFDKKIVIKEGKYKHEYS